MEDVANVEREYWHLTTASGVATGKDYITPEALVAIARQVSPPAASTPSSSGGGGHKRASGAGAPTGKASFSWESLLSQSGEHGQLKARFVNTPLKGKVWAHVVASEAVNSVSGWMETKDGPVYFSTVHEHWLYDIESIQAILDELIVDVATVCTE